MSNTCSCSTAASTITGTLTGGIQDIAALLPLLGTEQCEDHVSLALTKGYLYAAASPMSLLGSLGVARAGIKTFIASFCIDKWGIVGARTLSNMGFRSQGTNLPLIMVDSRDKDGRYLVETRLDELVKELHIDKTKIEGVSHKTTRWNMVMISLTGSLCLLAMFPYIFLKLKISSSLPHHTRWTFPALRAVGGFITSTTMQLVIQRRISTLTRRWISEHCTPSQSKTQADRSACDIEGGLKTTVADSNSPLTWFLLVLLLLGVLASVVGYVGCFSVVQSSSGSIGPLSWLCSEASLSLLRMFLWGYNPVFDDAPPLELVLKRDPDPPLPTCNLYDHNIQCEKVLPLTRANQFLNSITSFAGVVYRFDHPDVTLYYTLTRRGVPCSPDMASDNPDERVLYITIFDHKERANTRVFTRNGDVDRFYSTASSLPTIEPKLGLLEIQLGDEIDAHDDPIAGDPEIQSMLIIHYQSITDQLRFAIRKSSQDDKYRIENKWTMAMVDTTSAPGNGWERILSFNNDTSTSSLRDFLYLRQGGLERMRLSFSLTRREWVETYMHWGIRAIRERLRFHADDVVTSEIDGEVFTSDAKLDGAQSTGQSHLHKTSQRSQVSESEEVELRFLGKLQRIETMIVAEIECWEEQLWNALMKVVDRRDVLEKERLKKEWKVKCLKRLDADIRAMDSRIDAAKLEVEAATRSQGSGNLRTMTSEPPGRLSLSGLLGARPLLYCPPWSHLV